MIKETLMQRLQSLTAEDMQILDDVLTPSVSNVLNKIVPEIEPLITQFTQNDERQNFAVGGPIDYAERARQSQAGRDAGTRRWRRGSSPRHSGRARRAQPYLRGRADPRACRSY